MTESQSPQPAPARPPSAAYLTKDGRLHVTAWECHGCGHHGIDDGDDSAEACSDCDWRGPCPAEDICPACGRKGTMVSACPKCGDRYYIKAEADLAIPAPIPSPEGDVRNALAELLDECISSYQAGTLPKSISWDRLIAAQSALAAPAPHCARSHPHEDMSAECQALTVKARADNAAARCAAEAHGLDELRRDLIADTREVFDASGSETPQSVRDVIEYVDSWLQVQVGRAADRANVQPKGTAVAWLCPNESFGEPGEQRYLLTADDTHEHIRDLIGAFPVYREAPSPAPAPAEPVATLHDDGSFTWKRDEFRLKYDRQRAGWRMDVYAGPAPAVGPRYRFWVGDGEAAMLPAADGNWVRYNGWQPIKTAPKDGTHILVWTDASDTAYVVCWADAAKGIHKELTDESGAERGWHLAWDGELFDGAHEPTHWMPLPDGPDSDVPVQGSQS